MSSGKQSCRFSASGHHGCGLADQPLRDEARVEVDVLAYRMVADVLDAAAEDDVRGAKRDLAGAGCDRGERSACKQFFVPPQG